MRWRDHAGFRQQVMDDEERSVPPRGSGIPSGAPLALASALSSGRKTLQRPGGARSGRLVLGRFNLDKGDITVAARVIDIKQEKPGPGCSARGVSRISWR